METINGVVVNGKGGKAEVSPDLIHWSDTMGRVIHDVPLQGATVSVHKPALFGIGMNAITVTLYGGKSITFKMKKDRAQRFLELIGH